MDDREERIRAKAFEIWERDGKPEGRSEAHWEEAKLHIAAADGKGTMYAPSIQPGAEPVEALTNQGEFPGLTDQGATLAPSVENIPKDAAPQGRSGA